jgi:hypothetical protein|tara:strand:- start:272 stop:406 length:135 start_codon:yes stop_codon:yes gene_type:complete
MEKKQSKRFDKKYTNYVENYLPMELEEEENKHQEDIKNRLLQHF